MKKFAKILIVLMLLMSLLIVPATTFAAKEINVTVDGKAVEWTDAKPFVKDGRTLVPLRPIANALGVGVDWSKEDNMAIFFADFVFEDGPYCRYIGFEIDNPYAVEWRAPLDDNGNPMYVLNYMFNMMDTAAVAKDGRTYAPARYLAEYFGYDVNYDAATSTVVITDDPNW